MAIKNYDRPDRCASPFGVKWSEKGRRRFKFFKSAAARDVFAKAMQKQADAQGRVILSLSAAEASIMAECIKKVGSAAAVLQAVERYAVTIQRKPMMEALKEFNDEKYNAGLSDDHLRHMKKAFEHLQIERFAFADDVRPEDARRFVSGLAMSPVTIKGYAVRLKIFFGWLVDRGYARENAFLKLQLPKIVESEPGFLTVDETRSLLETAQKHHPDAVVYFALGAFAGLRSTAMTRMDSEKHVKFDQRGILITGDVAKNSRRQFVDGHEPNLWAWLEWARDNAPEGFVLSPRMWERRREQVSEKAEVVMPHNALRHSFCTYHCALHGNAGKTATLLTHRGNVAILYEHYKGNAGRTQAEEYFRIVPKAEW